MDSNTPTVSVILCTYNGSITWRVYCQRHGPGQGQWELLVSMTEKRDVGDIVAAFSDPRVRYFNRRENTARRLLQPGIRESRGRYIAYIDDDDLWYPNHLSGAEQGHGRAGRNIGRLFDLYAVTFIRDDQWKTGSP
jgi:glycosyltransferase involved in cell wall biosynthesis